MTPQQKDKIIMAIFYMVSFMIIGYTLGIIPMLANIGTIIILSHDKTS